MGDGDEPRARRALARGAAARRLAHDRVDRALQAARALPLDVPVLPARGGARALVGRHGPLPLLARLHARAVRADAARARRSAAAAPPAGSRPARGSPSPPPAPAPPGARALAAPGPRQTPAAAAPMLYGDDAVVYGVCCGPLGRGVLREEPPDPWL